jgi:hypothetical protein
MCGLKISVKWFWKSSAFSESLMAYEKSGFLRKGKQGLYLSTFFL